jgi:hypothetical protein
MNDFLHALALRSLQPGAAIRPRLPSLFEPSAPGERLPIGGLAVQPPSGQLAGDTSTEQSTAPRETWQPDRVLRPAEEPAPLTNPPQEPRRGLMPHAPAPIEIPPRRRLPQTPERGGPLAPTPLPAAAQSQGAPVLPTAAEERRLQRPPQAPLPLQPLAQPAAMGPDPGRRRLVPGIARMVRAPAGDPLPRERRGEPGRSSEQLEAQPAVQPEPTNPPSRRIPFSQIQPLVVATPERVAPSTRPSRREARFAAEFRGMAPQEEAPLVQVTIGRIEIRARQVVPPPPPGGRSENRLPVMSLDEHLHQRNGGGR